MSPRSSATSKNSNSAPRRLVVSFHDLHPGSQLACTRFLERLGEFGINRVSLLVVPCWHGGPPFTHDEAFSEWLRQRAAEGHEICLHGYSHRVQTVVGGPLTQLIGRQYTSCEGEFFQIDYESALTRLRHGRSMLVDDAGLDVVGFTPPAWLLSDEGRMALVEAGFAYTTSFNRVDLLQHGRTVRAPTLVYSCRTRWRRLLSRAWVRVWFRLNRQSEVLRVAVHPGDLLDRAVEASIYRLVREALAAGRLVATYRDLLPRENATATQEPIAAA